MHAYKKNQWINVALMEDKNKTEFWVRYHSNHAVGITLALMMVMMVTIAKGMIMMVIMNVMSMSRCQCCRSYSYISRKEIYSGKDRKS